MDPDNAAQNAHNSPQMPSLGRIVLITTWGTLLNSQREHAAVVTQVWGNNCLNATVFPGSGPSLQPSSVMYYDHSSGDRPDGTVTWRWPPRV